MHTNGGNGREDHATAYRMRDYRSRRGTLMGPDGYRNPQSPVILRVGDRRQVLTPRQACNLRSAVARSIAFSEQVLERADLAPQTRRREEVRVANLGLLLEMFDGSAEALQAARSGRGGRPSYERKGAAFKARKAAEERAATTADAGDEREPWEQWADAHFAPQQRQAPTPAEGSLGTDEPAAPAME